MVEKNQQDDARAREAATESADLLVSSYSAQPLVQTASEKSGVPYVNAMLQPQHRTKSGAASPTWTKNGWRPESSRISSEARSLRTSVR